MPLFSITKTFLSNLLGWIVIFNQRRALRELTVWQLNDIGVSRKEAMNEARRAFWDHSRSLEKNGSIPRVPSLTNGKHPEELPPPSVIVPGK